MFQSLKLFKILLSLYALIRGEKVELLFFFKVQEYCIVFDPYSFFSAWISQEVESNAYFFFFLLCLHFFLN
jgi:hypothetical protein